MKLKLDEMSRVFFISDLHFGHENLCRGLRGMSAEESDNLIITNWNKTVTKRDVVFICGDVTMDKPAIIREKIPLLNGILYCVAGNHDTRKCCKALTECGVSVIGNVNYNGFILSHIPLREEELRGVRGNIHGHIHTAGFIDGLGDYKPKDDYGDKYINVNCEFHNYTPILFTDIEAMYKERKLRRIMKLQNSFLED